MQVALLAPLLLHPVVLLRFRQLVGKSVSFADQAVHDFADSNARQRAKIVVPSGTCDTVLRYRTSAWNKRRACAFGNRKCNQSSQRVRSGV